MFLSLFKRQNGCSTFSNLKTLTGALTTAGILSNTKENNQQMEKERREMDEERNRLTEERMGFEEERATFAAEQRKWMDKIVALETELTEKSVVSYPVFP